MAAWLDEPPVTTYVFKLASRCNLACSYCYMYTGPDQSWRDLPNFMTPGVYESAFERIARHTVDAGLPQASIVIHGGEPLLAGVDRLTAFLEAGVRILGSAGLPAHFALQTNGTLLSKDMAHLLSRYNVDVGFSIDVDPESHDRERRTIGGKPTYTDVVSNLAAATEWIGTVPTVIGVADFSVPPSQVLDHFEALGLEHAEILLPDLNWDSPPPDTTMVGRWLVELFDAYMDRTGPLRLRIFQTLLALRFGAPWGSDAWGLRSTGTLIIETDGGYHYHDVLRTAAVGTSDSGHNVLGSPIADVAAHPMLRIMTSKSSFLPQECTTCPHKTTCGGGHIAHRYSTAKGFDNPSVYCDSITILLDHIARRLEPVS